MAVVKGRTMQMAPALAAVSKRAKRRMQAAPPEFCGAA